MVMIPDPKTAFIEPFYTHKTLHLTCNVHIPGDSKGYDRCPRSISIRATEYMLSTGIADQVMTGPEAEFFLFDNVSYVVENKECSYSIDGDEASWNSRFKGKNLANRYEPKNGYFPVSPLDGCHNIRSDMLITMASLGVPIEKHHHEVATCQHELGIKYQPLVESADALQLYKYVVKNVAKIHNKTATFMAKPIFGDNGSGMHVHQSLWKDGKNLFYDENGKYCELSELALYYMGGILHHAPAILAFTNPTTNSYKRLIPGYEAPVNLVYSKGNRSAAIRIPIHQQNEPKAKRIEFRCPDPTSNPYIAFSVILMAGLDGIKNKIHPGEPTNADIYELVKAKTEIRTTPRSLKEALDALEQDHQFLLEGGVFSKDFIHSYIALKREEIERVEVVPHPVEFAMYYQY